MYKIIVCDLDETLVCRDCSIARENIEAVQAAVAAGVKFVPATGRGYNSVHNTLRELGLDGRAGQYVISYNGGAITENKDDRLLYFQGITFEEAEALYKRGLQYDGICIHVYTRDEMWVRNLFPEEEKYIENRLPHQEIFGDDIDFLKGQEIVKAIYMNTDYDYLRKIESEITDLTGNMDVSFSSNRYMEFNRRGVSKGSGLRRLCNLLGVDIKDTIAIGDNFNDLSMIETAGLGVGVANTIEGMRGRCDVITENDCDHSAVAEVIRKYIFSE